MQAYELMITLRDVEPPVWRHIIVPADIPFRRLHDTIQLAMGWQDYHLYEFDFPASRVRIVCNDEAYDEHRFFTSLEGRKILAEMKHLSFIPDVSYTVRKAHAKIDRWIEEEPVFEYTYDFGDNWEHDIEVLRVVDDYPHVYPQVLNAEGNCPPEDCGGPSGYESLLFILKDKAHPEHKDLKEWAESMGYGPYDRVLTNIHMKTRLKLKREK